MDKKQIEQLLLKYESGDCSEEEKALLENWYVQFREDKDSSLSEAELSVYLASIRSKLPLVEPDKAAARVRLWPRIAVAAALAVAVFGAGLFYLSKNNKDQAGKTIYANDIAPGKMGATLTLANGRKIRLSGASKGELAKEAGLTISKTAEGQVIYSAASLDGESGDKINTLSTAKGETYILTLSDKTQVWLNAASSLTYSAALNERGQRRVKLAGEAYFQVAKDKLHPFIVESRGQQVEVLGTHFNVSAYDDDETVKTTLVEGSVKVSTGVSSKVLKPNQQSALYNGALKVENVDAEDAVAWKNGLFVFEVESLQSLMRKVARWYDVEVIYTQGVDKNELYFGSVSRYDNISKVLETLELTKGIHFKIEGRRITIMK